MPKGNRGGKSKNRLVFVAAFVAGVLTAVPIGIAILSEASYQHHAANEATQQARYADQKASYSCLSVPVPQMPNCRAEARVEAELEKRSYKHDEEDLVAQRKAALWAEMMGLAALYGVFLSIVGAVLLGASWFEAKEGNRINRDTARRQLRPYVYIGDEATLELPFALKSRVKLSVKNFGLSPAFNFQMATGSALVKRPIGDQARDIKLSDWESQMPVLGPHGEVTLNMGLLQLGAASLQLIQNGQAAFIARHAVRYEWFEDGKSVTDGDEIIIYVDKATCESGEVLLLNEWARHHSHIEPEDSPELDL